MEEKVYKGTTSVYELRDGHSSNLFMILDRGKKVSLVAQLRHSPYVPSSTHVQIRHDLGIFYKTTNLCQYFNLMAGS